MGGKGSKTPDPPAVDNTAPQQNLDQTYQMMAAMMQQQNQVMQAMANQPPPILPQAPPIVNAVDVDWTEKNKQLAEKARADYNLEKARQKGRTDTILTSPLLDEEQPLTTSLLTG